MRQSASDNWFKVTQGHEGIVPWLYLDKLGLVTTAVGNLAEDEGPESAHRTTGKPNAFLFTMPWKRTDGTPASRAEIQAAFDQVKSRQDLAPLGGGNPAFAALTSLRLGPPTARVGQLTPEITQVVREMLDKIEVDIRRQIGTGYDSWPADAQLAILEWAWAKGDSFNGWPALKAALTSTPPNFARAKIESHISNATSDRNAMTAQMWQNAADVASTNADPDRVYYPGTVTGSSPALVAQNPPRPQVLASLAPGSLSTGAKVAIGIGAVALAGGIYWWSRQ